MKYSRDKAGQSRSAEARGGRSTLRFGLPGGVLLLCLFVCSAWSRAEPAITYSPDSTPIAYEVHGDGEPTLILVHGWSCDSRYWREQVDVLARRHRVVTVDLAGHGHSGLSRDRYTMRSFGADVKAVADAVGSRQLILVGHSMGGLVIAEAARLMPDRVLGLIGVDTLQNVEYQLSREEYNAMTEPLFRDFRAGSRQFVATMLSDATAPVLREWIMADMAAAPPQVAMSAMAEMMRLYIDREVGRIFEEIAVPVVLINAGLWPVDEEANRRHMQRLQVITVKGSDHFLMLGRPAEFNAALDSAIESITGSKPGK